MNRKNSPSTFPASVFWILCRLCAMVCRVHRTNKQTTKSRTYKLRRKKIIIIRTDQQNSFGRAGTRPSHRWPWQHKNSWNRSPDTGLAAVCWIAGSQHHPNCNNRNGGAALWITFTSKLHQTEFDLSWPYDKWYAKCDQVLLIPYSLRPHHTNKELVGIHTRAKIGIHAQATSRHLLAFNPDSFDCKICPEKGYPISNPIFLTSGDFFDFWSNRFFVGLVFNDLRNWNFI